MKKYIYIDTNLISTYLAQYSPNGIEDSITFVDEKNMLKSQTKSTSDKNTGDNLEVSLAVFKYAHSINRELIKISDTITNSKLNRKEVNYKQHAINKLNQFEKLNSNEVIKQTDKFDFYDLDNLIDISTFVLIDNYEFFLKNSKNNGNNNKKNMKNGLQAIKYFKMIFPSSIYLESKNYIIPLNKEYLLTESSLIDFLYNDKTTIIGIEGPCLNNYFSKNEPSNLVKNIKDSLNSAKTTFLENLDFDLNKKILVPIAWYQD